MKKTVSLLFFSLVMTAAGCGTGQVVDNNLSDTGGSIREVSSDKPAGETAKEDNTGADMNVYAFMEITHAGTDMGTVKIKLYPDLAPVTVTNFIELAEGTKEFIDPATGDRVKSRYYDNLIFHRVIPDFMIQGGDPTGTGRGGPGYRFKDEIVDSLKFDKPGKLAMANAGPNTNGSQFFITVVPTPWLNGKHTIFGEVVSGQEIVNRVSEIATGSQNRPLESVIMKKVYIKEE